MSERTEPTTSAQIWRDLTPEQRLVAARALWADEDSGRQQLDAVQSIARQLRFRPQSVPKLGPEKLARHLAALRSVSESLASRALILYHLASQRPMLAAFLNHLGVAHDEGLITETPKEAPEPERLRAAAESLVAAFPAADVHLYFRTLAVQDPEAWGALGPIATELFPSGPQG